MSRSRSSHTRTRRLLAGSVLGLAAVALASCAAPTSPTATTVTTATTAGGSVASCPSGECLSTGAPSGWRLVFSDDFNTAVPLGSFPTAVASRWGAYEGVTDTSGHGTYQPDQVVSVHDGMLDIDLHSSNGEHLVGAVYPKIPGGTAKDGFVQGRYVVRFRSDETSGYKLTSLLWPDSNDNLRDGEIDFPEADLDEAIYAYTHRIDASSGGDQDWFATGERYGTWHTAVIERTSTAVSYWMDGRLIGTSNDRLSSAPMSWVIQAETSLHDLPSNDAEAHVLVDWVAAYQPT